MKPQKQKSPKAATKQTIKKIKPPTQGNPGTPTETERRVEILADIQQQAYGCYLDPDIVFVTIVQSADLCCLEVVTLDPPGSDPHVLSNLRFQRENLNIFTNGKESLFSCGVAAAEDNAEKFIKEIDAYDIVCTGIPLFTKSVRQRIADIWEKCDGSELVKGWQRSDIILPGKVLLEDFMGPSGLSVGELAKNIAVTPLRLNEIIKGKRTITAGTALRLGKFFGVSPETWMNLQMNYDLSTALWTTWKDVEPFIKTQATKKRKQVVARKQENVKDHGKQNQQHKNNK